MSRRLSVVAYNLLADIAAMKMHDGTPLPFARPVGLQAGLSAPLAGLIKRGYLVEYKRNFFRVSDEGHEALEREKKYHVE